MKKNMFLVRILFLVFGFVNLSYADIVQYKRVITQIEDMLDGIKPLDRAQVEKDLNLLRATTQSPERIERINRAYRRFKTLVDEKNRPRRVPTNVPAPRKGSEEVLPRSKKSEEPVIIPEPQPKKIVRFKDKPDIIPIEPRKAKLAISHEQQLEALLLYTQSLASTADVAIIMNQKNNAQEALAQAVSTVGTIRNLLMQHPALAPRFAQRVQVLSDRVAKTQEEVAMMQ